MFDFEQHREVADLEKVPEQFRPLYVEKEEGEGFELSGNETVKSAVEAIVGLNRSLKAARSDTKKAKAGKVDLSALSEYGESVDEIVAGVSAKLEELDGQLAAGKDAKINIDKIKEELAKVHAKDVGVKDTRITALTGQLYKLMVETSARQALDGKAIDADLVMPFLTDRIKVVEEDNVFQVLVVDEQGDRRFSGVTGTAMTIKDLVGEMQKQDKFAPLFKSEAPKGSGHLPGTSVTPTPTIPGQKKTSHDKIRDGLVALGKRK